ncbi:hypothetical protein EJ03DRAFT_326239 [Teratosphaeria nubilosa]|uniref:F-box domain-containing protein n=1 Tax=Teratosphaeria nubilosa TaxID=161662 RepID=A0A6G1LCE8_9PEZI|nr:hypothetical protein EJ03DRAFT_326239 [Teratosphaeria nubilosa]
MDNTAESSINQVFRLPELLELILLNLPQRDILLCQRTSRNFRQTVEGSIRLQRALFFAPDWNLRGRSNDPYAATNRSDRRKPENNRILRRAFDANYPTVTLHIENHAPIPSESAIGKRGSERWTWDVCISFPAGDKTPTHRPAVDYPEASWRRMYISQPPPQTLHLVRRWQKSLNAAIECEEGITMGGFYECCRAQNLKKTTDSWHESYVGSDGDWHMEGNIRCSSIEE